MKRLTKVIVLAAIAAALVAGCGDDDDDDQTTTTTTTGVVGSITIDRWTTQADRICAEGDRGQQQAAEQQFGEELPTEDELVEFGETVVVPNLQSQHDAIAALPKPEAEAEQIDATLSALQEGIDAIAADPSLLVQGTDSVPAIAQATQLAQDLGLTNCGSG